MPNVVKYQSGGSETHSIKKGIYGLGLGVEDMALQIQQDSIAE